MKLSSLVACWLIVAGPALAASYDFTPLPSGFRATALNNLGQVAGSVGPAAISLYEQGTLRPFTSVLFTTSATLTGLNDIGDFVGVALDRRGNTPYVFVGFGNLMTNFETPGNTSNGSNGNSINNRRQIVGSGIVSTPGTADFQRGYVTSGQTSNIRSILFDVPGAAITDPTDINDAGRIVGNFALSFSAAERQGFVLDNGTYTAFSKPGAVSTLPVAINEAGEIAGTYTDTLGLRHGFVRIGDIYTEVTGPDGTAFLPIDFNNSGQLLGTFEGSGLSYLATPTGVPEPSTALLLGTGLLAFNALRRRHGGSQLARVIKSEVAPTLAAERQIVASLV